MIDAWQGLIDLSRRMSVQMLPASTQARPGEKVLFALVNEGPGHISFGTPYALERCVDGAWTPCTVGAAWTAQLITLHPSGRHEGVANIPEDAPPGRYRVSKEVERRDSGGKDVVAFELDVVET
jgi:hypothetical protein